MLVVYNTDSYFLRPTLLSPCLTSEEGITNIEEKTFFAISSFYCPPSNHDFKNV